MRRLISGVVAGCVILHAAIVSGATGSTLTVRKDGVAVYAAPSSEAPVIMFLNRGRKLKELRRSGAWVKGIIYGEVGKEGWVRGTQIVVVDKETANKPKSPTDSQTFPIPKQPHANFVLVIKGAPQRFRARCTLVDQRGKSRRLRLDGRTPKSFRLLERAVDCRVDRLDQHAGMLSVALHAREHSIPVGSNSTHGLVGCVHVRSRGPWGKAFGRRCSRAVLDLRKGLPKPRGRQAPNWKAPRAGGIR